MWRSKKWKKKRKKEKGFNNLGKKFSLFIRKNRKNSFYFFSATAGPRNCPLAESPFSAQTGMANQPIIDVNDLDGEEIGSSVPNFSNFHLVLFFSSNRGCQVFISLQTEEVSSRTLKKPWNRNLKIFPWSKVRRWPVFLFSFLFFRQIAKNQQTPFFCFAR